MDAEEANTRPRLWNRNFFLLWQGQLVSAVGYVIYEIALGFWVLAVTGSTALMGTLMAASVLPRVLVAPAAGVIVDRADRKWLLVLMDAARGAAVVLVGTAALLGLARIWMVFTAGILIGLGAAFFNPAIGSALPDIVAREQVVRANSFFSMIRAASGILGNSVGGFLFALLGAPLMFLANGLSYLFSAFTELFIRVPAIERRSAPPHFLADLRSGLRFVWEARGLRFLLLMSGVLNFFAFIAIVLLIPFFRRTLFLGPGRYGITMAVFTVGMLAGMALTATVKIPTHRRPRVFTVSMALFVLPLIAFPLFGSFAPMLVCIAIGGAFNAVVNVLIQSVIQLAVPQEMRGKVMGLLETMSAGLTPLGMAAGGILGEFLPLRWVISGSFVVVGLIVLPMLASRHLRTFFAMGQPAQGSGLRALGAQSADGGKQGGTV